MPLENFHRHLILLVQHTKMDRSRPSLLLTYRKCLQRRMN